MGERSSPVEADLLRSNQHEFNGVKQLQKILGRPSEKVEYQTKFIYLNDDNSEPVIDNGLMTWYDSRASHPIRSEFRLYFKKNEAMDKAQGGDILLIALMRDGSLLSIVAEKQTTAEQQLLWLFGVDKIEGDKFESRDDLDTEHDRIDYILRFILEEIGLEVESEDCDKYLDAMLRLFNNKFPTTREFSAYSRSTLPDVTSKESPDNALLTWMDREESLFKTLEQHFLYKRIQEGFGDDPVSTFLKLSLSIQNRRKSRAGSALENHLEFIFNENGIKYSREPKTEGGHKPDFIFPGINEYHDSSFDEGMLTMLAAKTTCKERWRQIRNEANRVHLKHLLTLEPSISQNSTDEMINEDVQLVIPSEIIKSYSVGQQKWLITLSDFISIVLDKEGRIKHQI